MLAKGNPMELRGYRVEVKGFPPYLYYAENRGQARMNCARSIVEAWGCKMKTALVNVKRVVLATDDEIKSVAFDNEILHVHPESEVENVSK